MSEQRPPLEQFPLEDLLNIHQLIFLPGTLDLLIGHLDKGVADGGASPDLCSAILRLYLLYPQCSNAEVVRKILVQAIVALPDNHFAYYAGIAPTRYPTPEATKRVSDIFMLQDFLEGCNFKLAWAMLKEPEMVDVLHTPGLADAVRRFACDAMQLAFSTISLGDFSQLLNLGAAAVTGVDDRLDKILKFRGWCVEDVGPGSKAVRIASASRDQESSRPAATRASMTHKTVEKYLSVDGLEQCLALLQC